MLPFLRRYTQSLVVGMQLITEERFLGLLTERQHSAVLDVGCGSGEFSMRIAQKVGTETIVGIERVSPFAKMASNKGVSTILGDASNIFPFKDEVFDVVTANQVIEHLNNTDVFIKEIRRVLKQDGYCMVATPNLSGLQNIILLIMGYQPPTAEVSDEFSACGNPFHPHQNNMGGWIAHRRLFTAAALKSLFELHGFKCELITGFGLHPLPLFISRLITSPRYSPIIAIKAWKATLIR
jgi:SAM-dependent methyltransferase